MADIYNYAIAIKIARNSLPKYMKKDFYLKEIETSEIIDIHRYKSEASAIVDNKKISFDLAIVQQIKNEAENIMGLSAYTQEELIKKREAKQLSSEKGKLIRCEQCLNACKEQIETHGLQWKPVVK